VKNTLFQKQQCNYPNFSLWYNNKDKGKVEGKVVIMHAIKVHRSVTATLTLNAGTSGKCVAGFMLGTL
jgi:hypothetical protein